jgi:hypothetical protein
MNVPRLFLLEFGAFLLFFVLLLGRQILLHELVIMKQRKNVLGSAEGVVLLVIVAMIGIRYFLELIDSARLRALPELEAGWIAVFGTGCAIYLGAKAVRVVRARNN